MNTAPVLIGGSGGSGTRALRQALIEAGGFFGVPPQTNDSGDSEALILFYNRYLNAILRATRTVNYRFADVPQPVRAQTFPIFRRAVAQYLGDYRPGNDPWGIKNPRTLYALPYFRRLFPDFRLLHLVRDGRDMAISDNMWSINTHYRALFGQPFEAIDLAAASLWNKVNNEAADWAEARLGERYMWLRYEDLCATPRETLARVFDFLGWPHDRLDAATGAIRPSSRIGRRNSLEPARLDAIAAIAKPGLTRFGYLPHSP